MEKEQAFDGWLSQREEVSEISPDSDISQAVIKGDLTRKRAVEISLQHNRVLQAARQGEIIAGGRIKEAYSEAYPTLSASGSATVFDEEPVAGGPKEHYSAGVTLSQPLYRGGATGAGIRAAEAFMIQAEENLRYETQMTIFRTIKAFDTLRLSVSQQEVAEKDVALAEAHLKDVATRRKYGMASDFNVLRAQVALSRARADLLAFRQEQDTAKNSLLMIMGVSQESRIVPVGQYEFSRYNRDEEEAIHEAFLQRPEVSVAELAVKLQREAVIDARSSYRPTADFFADYTHSNPEPDNPVSDKWSDIWSTGITVNFDLFDGRKRDGLLVQAEAALRQRKTELAGLREQVVFEVKTAILAVKNAEESVRVQELVTQQADEGLRIAEVGYRQGTIDQVSLLEARTSLIKAQLLYQSSLYQHAAAVLSLKKAMGALDPEEYDSSSAAGR
jgi:outer membrane protein TolC